MVEDAQDVDVLSPIARALGRDQEAGDVHVRLPGRQGFPLLRVDAAVEAKHRLGVLFIGRNS
eukprot:3185820-Alexandrium_andersonii.AAC.1